MKLKPASLLLALTVVAGGVAHADDAFFPLDLRYGQKLVISFETPSPRLPDADTIAIGNSNARGNSGIDYLFEFALFDGDQLLGSFTTDNAIGLRQDLPALFTSPDSNEMVTQAVVDFSSIRDGSIDGRMIISSVGDDASPLNVMTYNSLAFLVGMSEPEPDFPPVHFPHLIPQGNLVILDAVVVPSPTGVSLAALAGVVLLGRPRR